jgi:putative membrane protein
MMNFREAIIVFFKGMGMGAANVVPGVSGGTIALITGIFERLIDAIKSFNLKALKLLLKFKIKDFLAHIDFWFLASLFLGVGVAIISVAKLFEFMFENYPIYIWAFFFGLVLASVYFVGKQISRWDFSTILSFLIGTAAAVAISVLNPASENSSMYYLFICGIIAACSMILPGLSGSFVLILLGNYQLVMIDAVTKMDLEILLPVVIGALVGVLGFSYLLSWVFKKFRNQTIGLLTGFVLGSVMILWPWKNQIFAEFGNKAKLVGYNWYLPEINSEFFIATAVILVGVLTIWLMEKYAGQVKTKEEEK